MDDRADALVLVVDDDPTLRLLARTALEQGGFRVAEAVDGLDGLQKVQILKPDLVLLDVLMPGMNGFELCERLRRDEATRTLPVLVVTGLEDTASIERAYACGATSFAAKPMAWPSLAHTVRYMLRNADLVKTLNRTLVEFERARDRAETANNAKTEFLANISHEIRTPLNGVLGMVQAMFRDELSPVQRERLMVLDASGVALMQILNDVLDLAKIESGRQELNLVEFDLADVANAVSDAFSAQATEKGVSFSVSIQAGTEGRYVGDPLRLRQIISNLTSNALRFTPKGQVSLDFDTQAGRLLIAVRDTGIGVEAHRLSELFDKFVQADSSTTRLYGGTGLGLAICREFTQLMGGAIEVESAVGVGSEFRVILPLSRIDDAPTAPDAAEPAPASPTPTLRVLAAEDNQVNQFVLKTLLEQGGLDVVIVENGLLALEAWRAQPWDLILMDVQMPVMDGLTATQHIREEEQRTNRPRTPIIALTANTMHHQVESYLAAGMDRVVPKPIQVQSLFIALEEALESSGQPADTN